MACKVEIGDDSVLCEGVIWDKFQLLLVGIIPVSDWTSEEMRGVFSPTELHDSRRTFPDRPV
jgi:hypothetical protein